MRSDLSQKTRNKLDNQIYSFFLQCTAKEELVDSIWLIRFNKTFVHRKYVNHLKEVLDTSLAISADF